MAKPRYTYEDKIRAADIYWANGSSVRETARQANVDKSRISDWAQSDETFRNRLDEITKQYDRKFQNQATRIIEKSFQLLEKRLEALIAEPGKLQTRDIAHTIAVLVDKRNLLGNRPTSISSRPDSIERRLKEMSKRLDDYQKEKEKQARTEQGASDNSQLASFPLKKTGTNGR
jgi:transposase-like protein